MKHDVVVYLSSVLNIAKHPKKLSCLKSFAEGVIRSGASVLIQENLKYVPSRLAVILGWVTYDKTTHNILLRQQIVNSQEKNGGHTMCIDAGCWKYADKENRFLRYSLGGPFYDQAEYANKNSSSQKWDTVSHTLGIGLEPWRSNGDYILICMQRDGGFSMKSLNPQEWLNTKIKEIRAVTNRPIIIRPHPGKPQDFSRFVTKGISIMESQEIPLVTSLKKAHAAIFFNSSSAVAAICQGVPIFVDDQSCVAWDVANKDIKNLENPEFFPREQWIYDLASAHWSDEEGKSGQIYKKFQPYLN